MTQPQPQSILLEKPFVTHGTWYAQAHIDKCLVAGLGSTEAQAKRALEQELKEFQNEIKQRQGVAR